MKKTSIFKTSASFLAGILMGVATCATPASAVKGGDETKPHAYPWLVHLSHSSTFSSKSPFCGGTLIHAQWVITAAHCVKGEKASELFVTAGDHDWRNTQHFEGTEQILAVKKIHIHPAYIDGNIPTYDIALIELETPAVLNNAVRPARLVNVTEDSQLAAIGRTAQVVGWGAWNRFFGEMSPVLSQATIKITGQSEAAGPVLIVKPVNGSPCWGDSGGPLLARDRRGQMLLIGIVSFGICDASNPPTAYTRVSRYLDWVYSVTGPAGIVSPVPAQQRAAPVVTRPGNSSLPVANQTPPVWYYVNQPKSP